MKAYALKQVDKDRDIHLQAFVNQVAKSTKQVGKKEVPVYQKFDDFFNYEEQVNKILKPEKTEEEKATINLIVQANSL